MSGSTVSTLPIYKMVSANEDARVIAFGRSDPQTKTDIAYFLKQAPKIQTADALLKDYRSLSIVLSAFGMKSALQQTALLKKLMTEDPTNKKSVAHRIANPTYLRFASAMAQFKTSPFANTSNVNALVKAVQTQNFEAAQDARSPGMADALYFKRTVGSLTTITQLMSDPRLLKVAQSATNMPDQFGTLDYSFQVKLLSKQITMKNFQNGAYVDKFVGRYLAIASASNATSADTTGAMSILSGSGSSTNILSALLPDNSGMAGTPLLSLFA
jgi:hypothetical protein